MATLQYIVDVLMSEAGKASSAVRGRMESKVKEVTLEMINQGDGIFEGLSKVQEISINTTDQSYLLNADFNRPKKFFPEFDTTDTFVRLVYIISEADYFDRLMDGAPSGANFCYIKKDESGASGTGNYLHLATLASTAVTWKFNYYRTPTENDTDVIDDWALLKRGVRASLPDLFPASHEVDAHIYLNKLPPFSEDPGLRVNEITIKPSTRRQKVNRLQHIAGRRQR